MESGMTETRYPERAQCHRVASHTPRRSIASFLGMYSTSLCRRETVLVDIFRKDLKDDWSSKDRCQNIGKDQNPPAENIIYDLICKFRNISCFFLNFLLIHIYVVFLLACTTKIYTNFQIIAQSALHGPQRTFLTFIFHNPYSPLAL